MDCRPSHRDARQCRKAATISSYRGEVRIAVGDADETHATVTPGPAADVVSEALSTAWVEYAKTDGALRARRVRREHFRRDSDSVTIHTKLVPHLVGHLKRAGFSLHYDVPPGEFPGGLVFGLSDRAIEEYIRDQLLALRGGLAYVVVKNCKQEQEWQQWLKRTLCEHDAPPAVMTITLARLQFCPIFFACPVFIPYADNFRGVLPVRRKSPVPGRVIESYDSLLPRSCACYGFSRLKPESLSKNETLLFLRYFGRLVLGQESKARSVSVSPAYYFDNAGGTEAGSTGIDLMRAAVWRAAARNAYIAQIAGSVGRDDSRNREDAVPAAEKRLAVLVTNDEHATALSSHLPALSVATKSSPGPVRFPAILTEKAADLHCPTIDVLMDARGSGPVPEGIFGDSVEDRRAELIDVVDRSSAELSARADARCREYRDRGWSIINNKAQ